MCVCVCVCVCVCEHAVCVGGYVICLRRKTRLCVCDLFLKMNKTRVFSTKVCVCVCVCMSSDREPACVCLHYSNV